MALAQVPPWEDEPDGAVTFPVPPTTQPLLPLLKPEMIYPIVVSEWPRNQTEVVRVTIDKFNDGKTIDIRAWWQDSKGTRRPGRSGLTLSVKHLPALADGIAEALRRAQALGLIEPGTHRQRRTR